MTKYDEQGRLLCARYNCNKVAEGDIDSVDEETFKRVSISVCDEHLCHFNKIIHNSF